MIDIFTPTMVFGPGTWLIFGVILVPIYVMVAAWFIGDPGDVKRSLMGVTYVVGITVMLWMGLFMATLFAGVVFYDIPGLHNIGPPSEIPY